jgi:hypothetical protein
MSVRDQIAGLTQGSPQHLLATSFSSLANDGESHRFAMSAPWLVGPLVDQQIADRLLDEGTDLLAM